MRNLISSWMVLTLCVTLGATEIQLSLDGNRYSDLVIGVPFEDMGTTENAGAVNVIYGTSSGLTSTENQMWNQGSGIADSYEINDNFAKALAIGDFNGDGVADLAIGVPGEAVNDQNGSGAVHILYGSGEDGGLVTSGNHIITQESIGILSQAEEDEEFGATLAAGDFNSDGFDDLAIGAPHDNYNGFLDVGTVSIVYGSKTGIQTINSYIVFDGTYHEGDEFGAALTAGDFNNDNYMDLAIGVPFEDLQSESDSGYVHILYGASAGLRYSSTNRLSQCNFDIEDDCESGDWFGAALTTGDFNGDGFDDLAVGVPGEDINGTLSVGAVNVIYGSEDGFHGFSNTSEFWHQDVQGSITSGAGADNFGKALSAGDFNGNGFDSLVVGIPQKEINGYLNAGAIQVFQGTAFGLTTVNNQLFHQDSGAILNVAEDYDSFGEVVTTGDFNGDGFMDLAVGVPKEDLSGYLNAGLVHVIYGSQSGLTDTFNQIWYQDSSAIAGTTEQYDYFGSSLASSAPKRMKKQSAHVPVIMYLLN